ncbi:hypothetical protein C0J50_1153 [Silurus asotus]|uniref:Uncharacterized protein n=1 Tax=Silurus asotus TaxID=30991 RepID=A0AAD5AAR5_SILAS|nr:hypothetical protein C0J50_1153 [Silurus asotus]
MLLLGVVCAKRRCNYSVILSNYRTLTLAELKSLVPHILRSIYNLTQVFACFSKGKQKDRVTEVVARMGLFIRQNCRKILARNSLF